MANQIIVSEDRNAITVIEGESRIVEVVTQGPQGPIGPTGPQGPSGSSILNQITSGSVTASVDIGSNIFTLVSGSSTYLSVFSSGNLTVNGDATIQGNQFNAGTYWRAISGSNLPIGPWRGIAYGNGLFVAIADRGGSGTSNTTSIATSPDGVTWTFRTLPSLTGLTNIIYQNGIFVAVGRVVQRAFYSYDGINWFNAINMVGIIFNVTYGKDKFVASKIDNPGFRINISYDGKNWQSVSTPSTMDLPWTSITYADDKYVAIAESNVSGSIAISYDGITWNNVTRPSAGVLTTYNVTYGKGLFVVTCNQGKILTSPDGINWTVRDTPLTGLIWKCIFAGGVFIAAGCFSTTENRFIYSVDGITWQEANTPSLNNWSGFAYGNGMLAAVSYNGPDTGSLVASSGLMNSFVTQNDNITHGRQIFTDDVILSNTSLLQSGSFKLDVSGSSRFLGNMIITGSGNTSATNALSIVNSSNSSLLALRNDGLITIGDQTTSGLKLSVLGSYTTRLRLLTSTALDGISGTILNSAIDYTSNNLILASKADSTTSNVYIIPSTFTSLSGTVLVNGTTDDGVNRLQVSGSTRLSGDATITGSLTVTGPITAQTLVVQTITSSVSFITGSTKFGSLSTNTHEFTGSVSVSGSVNFGGTTGLYWDNANSRLGIGTNAPAAKVDINLGAGNITNAVYIRNSLNTGYSSVTLFDNRNSTSFIGQWGLFGTGVAGSVSNMFFYNTAGGGIGFYTGTGIPAADVRMLLTASGSALFGTTTDNGARLQVSGSSTFAGNMTITGSGSTSATNALTIVNSGGNNILKVINDGTVNFVAQTNTEDNNLLLNINRPNGGKIVSIRDRANIEIGNNNFIYPTAGDANATILRSANGLFIGQVEGTTTTADVFNISLGRPSNINNQPTLGTSGGLVQVIGQFNPTSGTAPFVSLRVGGTINQTGGANGITRGLYVNPTLTSAADFRAIEWSNNAAIAPSASWGLYGAGSAPNYLSGSLNIGTTTLGANILNISGSTLLRGGGNTSGTNALVVQNSDAVSIMSFRNDGRVSADGSNFVITKYTPGATTLTITNTGHNSAVGISTTSAVGLIAVSSLGVSTNNSLGASIYAAGGAQAGNISLGLLSNRALISSAGTAIGMNASAMLQVDSTTQGFLPPRMTTTQKNAISSPAAGLVVYDTTLNKLCVYTTAWETITSA